MKFICLGYADMSQFANMAEADLKHAMDECFDYDDALRAGGHFIGGEALQEPNSAITLRLIDGKVQVTDGPFAETKEQLGGILILEADNMEHAVELMSKHPGVRIGPFEIRPADEGINKLIQSRQELSDSKKDDAMMFAKPQNEHQWLQQLIGDWSVHHDCKMPDGSIGKTAGTMSCRSLGGMWLICESSGKSAEGDSWSSIMTLGFDSQKNRYVGTFVGSMMANIWLYEGILDSTRKRLALETVGPAFNGRGTCKYRDTIDVVHADRWLFTSEYQDKSGRWINFMSGEQTRTSLT